MTERQIYQVLVVGASSGGMQAITSLLTALPADFSMAILVVQHISASSDGSLADLLDSRCQLRVKEADEKEKIQAATVYLAPANYHLLLEPDLTLSLTVDEVVNYARPSIDVLFETAAEACGSRLIGLIMTGANSDGAKGLKHIKDKGGLCIVQDPQTAQSPVMPRAAMTLANPEHVLSVEAIAALLLSLHQAQNTELASSPTFDQLQRSGLSS